MTGRLFLIHWKETEAEALAKPLCELGWQVEWESEDGARAGKIIKDNPPDVVVIYLTRLPSHGRETADGLRSTKATRSIPIIFVGGQGEALAKTKAKSPDALYVAPEELQSALQRFGGNG